MYIHVYIFELYIEGPRDLNLCIFRLHCAYTHAHNYKHNYTHNWVVYVYTPLSPCLLGSVVNCGNGEGKDAPSVALRK